ncbi:MAG: F0F1 ATP synthase subunit B [Thermoanaerobaculia bacterium]
MKRLLLVLLLVVMPLGALAQVHEGGASPSNISQGSQKVGQEVSGAAQGEEAHGLSTTFLGLPSWLWQLVNMLLFLGLLWYLIRKPVVQSFDGRKAAIRQRLSEAEQRRAKADQLASDIQQRLSQIEREVAEILERAHEEGERQKQELIAAAETESQKILASAQNAVDLRVKQAHQELTEYAGRLATERAEQIVAHSITDEDRSKLFDESVREIAGVRS